MRNAKNSALNRYAVKNGTNRDGNEKVRKGLGCTNRSCRMDWFNPYRDGSAQYHPTANKIARQEPIFPLHEDGQSITESAPTMAEMAAMDRNLDVLDWESGRMAQDWREVWA